MVTSKRILLVAAAALMGACATPDEASIEATGFRAPEETAPTTMSPVEPEPGSIGELSVRSRAYQAPDDGAPVAPALATVIPCGEAAEQLPVEMYRLGVTVPGIEQATCLLDRPDAERIARGLPPIISGAVLYAPSGMSPLRDSLEAIVNAGGIFISTRSP